LVALPADARTREQLEWIADEVREAAGTANVWLARPTSLAQERELAASIAADRAEEYVAVQEQALAAASLDDAERRRVLKRLRAELHRVRRRDFFPPTERDAAVAAVEQLAGDNSSLSATAAVPANEPGERP
jgi:hypothetical protein